MADILIYVDSAPTVSVLQKSLEPAHHLHLARNIGEALHLLFSIDCDLIISQVFLKDQNVFDLLWQVKTSDELKDIPFLCFVCLQTPVARSFNRCLSATAKVLGACGYLEVEDFCSDNQYDLEKIKDAIEQFLHPKRRGGITGYNPCHQRRCNPAKG